MKKRPGRPEPAATRTAAKHRTGSASAPGWFSGKYRPLAEFLLILLLAFITYGNGIRNGYNLDDGYVVSLDEGNLLTQKGIRGIPEILTSKYSEGAGLRYGYRPLARISLAIEYSVWGNNPHASHTINILLFAVNCFLLLLFIRRIFGMAGARHDWIASLSVLLFIVHPIHTEVVDSIKNREEILCFIFILAAELSFFRFLEASDRRGRLGALFLMTLFTVLSLLSKQTGFNTFGIMLLIGIFRIARDYKAENSLLKKIHIGHVIRLAVSMFIVFLCLKIFLGIIPPRIGLDNMVTEFHTSPYSFSPPGHQFPNFVQTVFFYLKKLLIPFPLLFYYGYDMLPDRGWDSFYPYAGIGMGLALACLIYYLAFRKKAYVPVFWMLFFGLTLVPFSNLGVIFFYVIGIVGERLAYQASAAYCVLFVMAVVWLTGLMRAHVSSLQGYPESKLSLSILSVVLLPYLLITWNRNTDWRDMTTLYEHDIKWLDRSARANYMIGSQIMFEYESKKPPQPGSGSEVDRARQYFQKALGLYPGFNDALLSLGTLYGMYYKMPDSAVYYLEKVDSLPLNNYIKARERLGDVSYYSNKYDQAARYYRESFLAYTQNLPVYGKLQSLLLQQGKYDTAIMYADTALLNKWPQGYLHKADAYWGKHDTVNAVANYELAVRSGLRSDRVNAILKQFYRLPGK